uniref:Variant surface glycoprotein 1301 n=1 Tax=Trypanosoma brucei TaxID=5691 RepID=M4SW36_9TRYP|nr:variant surface glycoprotein 1301 [Trypanosoma brucei]
MFKLLYLLLALTMCCTSKLGQSAGEAINGPEFNLFCHMDVMLRKEEIKDDDEPDLTGEATAAETTIETIFTLTANDTYYNTGPEPTPGNAADDASNKQKRINQWLQTRAKFDDVAIADEAGAEKYRRVKHKDIPTETAKLLSVTHKRAGKIRTAIKKLTEDLSANADNIRAATRSALLGGDRSGKGAFPEIPADAFTTTYAAACVTLNGPGKSLASDMACLCGTGSSAATTTLSVCTTNTAGITYSTNYDTASNGVTIHKTLHSICEQSTEAEPLTPAAITAQLHAFATLLGRYTLGTATDKGNFAYGKGDDCTTQCTGDQASEHSCVNYAAAFKQNTRTKIGQAIKWYGRLMEARQKLVERKHLLRKLTHQRTKLISLADAMHSLYETAANAPATQTTNIAPENPALNTQIKCPKKKTTPAGCSTTNCDYDDTTKE